MERECNRYDLNAGRVAAILQGDDPLARETSARRWWELLVAAAALAIFSWLASGTERQPISVNLPWMFLLALATSLLLVVCGVLLWKRTRFS